MILDRTHRPLPRLTTCQKNRATQHVDHMQAHSAQRRTGNHSGGLSVMANMHMLKQPQPSAYYKIVLVPTQLQRLPGHNQSCPLQLRVSVLAKYLLVGQMPTYSETAHSMHAGCRVQPNQQVVGFNQGCRVQPNQQLPESPGSMFQTNVVEPPGCMSVNLW
jgi:hypothetical protein